MRAVVGAIGLLFAGCAETSFGTVESAVVSNQQRLALAAVGGRTDLHVFSQSGRTFRAAFTLSDPLAWGSGVTWTDYDGDGLDDVVASYDHPNNVVVLHNDDANGLSIAETRPFPLFNAHGFDEDGDGDGDVWMGESGGRDTIARSDGSGLQWFAWYDTEDLSAWERGIASIDLDGDGYAEVAVARGSYDLALYKGGASGPARVWNYVVSTPPTFPPPPSWSADDADFVDFDGDGHAELATLENLSNGVSTLVVRAWDGSAMTETWSSSAFGTNISSVEWADFDGDGDADLSTCQYDSPRMASFLHLFRRSGTTFVPVAFEVPCGPLAWGDYDGDGDQDLATSDVAGTTIYENVNGSFESVFHDAGIANKLAWGRCGTGKRCFSHSH